METTTHATRSSTQPLTRWMRIVGVFYLAQFVAMAFVHAPIRTFGPEGALDAADAGDPIAEFLVDTWTTFGIEVGAIGVALVVAAARPRYAWGVAATVLAIELTRGILNDVIFIARGIEVAGYLVWIAIHSVVIVAGLVAMRRSSTARTIAAAA
ncbi:MAG TPA: BphX family protein [Acidimicrobiales bacterium]|nr:BphX family protein [Acidimicrobiales bacterium]